MLHGSFWRTILVTLLLLAPLASSAPPVASLPSAHSLGAQDVTDLALDPSGEYAVGVVKLDSAKLDLLPGTTRHDDVYPCHFGPTSSASISGAGCRTPGLRQSTSDTALSNNQFVDITSFVQTGGRTWRWVVGGPSDHVSFWANTNEKDLWRRELDGNQAVVAVAIATDASRVIAATAPSAGGGRVFVYDNNGNYQWDWNLSGNARPTVLDHARTGNLVVMGSTTSITFLKPHGPKPTLASVHPIETGAPVNDVVVAGNGLAAVAATTQGVYYVPIFANGTPETPSWFRSLSNGASKVALSLDGERFAAASGNKVHFFRHLNNSLIAEPVGEAYDAGIAITDLAYNADGSLLVAIAGNRVMGFGPRQSAPVWSFDATLNENGALDGPLTEVAVSDGGERIVVAGKTKLMPYRTRVSASAAFTTAQGLDVAPASSLRFPVTVTNTGSIADNYTLVARFPPGWNGAGPDAVALAPDQSATVNVTLEVPAGQAPGFYALDLEVRSQFLSSQGRTQTAVAGAALNFTIPRSVALNVTTSQARLSNLQPGGNDILPVRIRNDGNALGVVNLSTTQVTTRGSPWTLRFADDQVEIPAGQSVDVNLEVSVPREAASGDRNDITIIAKEGRFVTAMTNVTAYVDPKFGAELIPTNETAKYEFGPGELKAIRVTLVNNGNTDDVFNVTFDVTPASVASDWRVTLDKSQFEVARGEKRTITATVRATVAEPRDASLLLTALSLGEGETVVDTLTLALVARPPEPEEERNLLPGPAPMLVVVLVALAAFGRRLGGRR